MCFHVIEFDDSPRPASDSFARDSATNSPSTAGVDAEVEAATRGQGHGTAAGMAGASKGRVYDGADAPVPAKVPFRYGTIPPDASASAPSHDTGAGTGLR